MGRMSGFSNWIAGVFLERRGSERCDAERPMARLPLMWGVP